MTKEPIFTRKYFLPAGETDAHGQMPVTAIVARCIEVATLHANDLGLGYSNLAEHHLGWVLARVAVEVDRYPRINEDYTMSTWIESYNRYFSNRCYEMTDRQGNRLASIRSVWVAIDMEKRTMTDLSHFDRELFPLGGRKCPIIKCATPLIEKDSTLIQNNYTFEYRDIDFNRHVNTLRYLDIVLNQRPLDFYDHSKLIRLEASFDRECHFGDCVKLTTGKSARQPDSLPQKAYTTEITTSDGHRAASVELVFEE